MKHWLVAVAILGLAWCSGMAMFTRPNLVPRLDEDVVHTGSFVITNPVFNYDMETWADPLVYDAGPNLLHMSNIGPVQAIAGTNSDGRIEYSARFDGTNDFLSRPYNAAISNTLGTIMWWWKYDVLPGSWMYMLDIGRNDQAFKTELGVRFDNGAAGDLEATLRINSVVQWSRTTTNFYGSRTNQWIHFAITQDGTNPVIFIDGTEALLSSSTLGGGTWLANLYEIDHMTIGALLQDGVVHAGTVPWDGEIDNVLLFNRWMAQPEIALFATNTYPPSCQSYR